MRQRWLGVAGLALAVTALAAPAAAQDWAGRGRISAIVLDDQAKPVEGASLKLRFAADETVVFERELTTDKKGKCSYLGLKGGSWILRVEAIGFEPWEQMVEIYSQGIAEPVHVNLVRLPDEVVRAQRMATAADLYDQAGALSASGDYEKARAEYEKVLAELAPADQPPVLVSLAKTYMDEGRLEEAAAVLERSLAIDPAHIGSLRTLCAVVAAQGKMVEAEALLARIPADEPIHPTTLINIGMTHYNNGESEAAKPFLDRAVAQQQPVEPLAHYYRGLVELSLGANDEARADFETFLSLAPDRPEAATAREYLGYLTKSGTPQ